MKPFLLFRARDFDLISHLREIEQRELRRFGQNAKPTETRPKTTADLLQDLELNVVLAAMSAGDAFLREVSEKILLASLHDPEEILYRQAILRDCLAQPEVVKAMYSIAVEAVARERRVFGWSLTSSPTGVLRRSLEVLQIFLDLLKKLRQIADERDSKFSSNGFRRFFRMIDEELSDDYIKNVETDLQRLEFSNGVLISARLTHGAKGNDYRIRKPWQEELSWRERLGEWFRAQVAGGSRLLYEVDPRDEAGARALEDLRAQGIASVAAALAESADHILGFFQMLHVELGFYVACLNLHGEISNKGLPCCFPEPLAPGAPTLSARGLFDLALFLTTTERVIGNNLAADGKQLIMITGANRGGKSTFLRSLGLAQVMMQAGVFVVAEAFRANVCDRIYTHFKREEDAAIERGKLDEELSRMSMIVDVLTPNSLVLFNESFSSTNEREGSEIARQILLPLLESRIKVLYVTHLFSLANEFHLAQMDSALFLRAERLSDGTRTFRIVEGEPQPTSYGEDLYVRIFRDPSETRGRPAEK